MSVYSHISLGQGQEQGQLSDSPQKRVVVAMPAYNEEKYIGTMVIGSGLYSEEILVVDDGSSDNTSIIARLAGATVIKHEKNWGKGAAVQTIMREARDRDIDVLVIMDSDAQHKFEEIPQVIKPIMEGYDIVIGSRIKQKKRITFYRRIGQIVLSFLSRVLSGANIADSECGFRAFSRKAIEALHLSENGFAIETEIIAEASAIDLKMTEVPISVIYTNDGSTLNAVVHGVGNVIRIFGMFLRKKPVLALIPLGGLVVLVGIIINHWLLHSFSLTLAALNVLSLVSLLFIGIGMLAILTGLILHICVKHRG